jgi:hypothetical protein
MYVCIKCNKTFKRKYNKESHMENVHAKDDDSTERSSSDDAKAIKDAEDSEGMEKEIEDDSDDSGDEVEEEDDSDDSGDEESTSEEEEDERNGDGDNIQGKIWIHYFNTALQEFDSEAIWSREFIDHVGKCIQKEILICNWLRRTKFYHNIRKTVKMYQNNGVNVTDAYRKAWQSNRNLIQSYMKDYIHDVTSDSPAME